MAEVRTEQREDCAFDITCVLQKMPMPVSQIYKQTLEKQINSSLIYTWTGWAGG